MKRVVIVLAFLGALVLHGAILLLGGLVLFPDKDAPDATAEVDLLSGAVEEKKDEAKDDEKRDAQESAEEAPDESLKAEAPEMPDLRNLAALEGPANGPALAAMSLSDLESALGGSGGGAGGFATGFSFASGGRIGATGLGGPGGDGLDAAFSIADLDQRPRPIIQTMPDYPVELRKRKVEGTVQVVFLVDREGRVTNPRVEKSTNPAFERPALEAVRRWKFEPGTRSGQHVAFKMRVPITFNAG
jgi:TonB family protein